MSSVETVDTLYVLERKPFWEWHLNLLENFDTELKKYAISEENYIKKYGKKGIHRIRYVGEAVEFLIKLYGFYGDEPYELLPKSIRDVFTAAWKYFLICLDSPDYYLDMEKAKKDLEIENLKENYA